MPPLINEDKCIGCGTCAEICNSHIFVFHRGKNASPQVKFPDECWHCNCCVIDCPVDAVTLRIPLAFMLLNVKANTLKPKRSCDDSR